MDYERMANEELAVRAQEGDNTAAAVLYENVQRLICKLAQPYITLCGRYGIDEADLLQECWFGFHRAVLGYKAEKGLFTSYLGFHIKTACRETVGIRGRAKHVLAASLDEPLRDADDLTTGDMIEDESVDVTGGAELTDLQRIVRCAISRLPERQQKLVDAVYVQELPVTEYARLEGISQAAGRALKDKTLRELRRDPGIRAFAPFYTGRKRTQRGHGSVERRIEAGTSLYLAWCSSCLAGSLLLCGLEVLA